MLRLGIVAAAMLISAMPALAQETFATCYYNHADGQPTGTDWGNQSISGTLPAVGVEWQSTTGDYAIVVIVNRNSCAPA